ncbi:MAG TPA: PAS domain S-box protein [Polyangia bacterium]|jgi:PAS domain S-box-containing protein|nr:PAS domain S-box protein [Polyangia bacterium]
MTAALPAGAERSLLIGLARAIAHPEPELALERALVVLATFGITAAPPGDPQPWLRVSARGGRIELTTPAPPDPEVRNAVEGMLRATMERCEADDEAARLRDRLETFSSASFEGIFIHGNGIIIEANDRLAEMLGYSRDELVGFDVLNRAVAPDEIPGVVERLQSKYEGEYIVTAVRRDGSRFRAELLSKEGYLGDAPVRIVAVRDVTERERIQGLLRESEAHFRSLAEAAFDLTVFSSEGVIVDIRGACERVLGRRAVDLIGRPVFEFMAPSSAAAARKMIEDTRLGFIEGTAVHADGTLVPMEAMVVESTLDGRPVRVAGVRDLRPARRHEAERRALERQLERTQRLDSLGVLAGGIAHDFNNILAGVLGNAELLLERLPGADDRELAEAIQIAAQRAADLTRQMLAYAGQRDLGRKAPVDLGEVIQELRTLLVATLSKKAQLEVAAAADCLVMGDRATLSQVLMNLLTNASDALGGETGRIDVRIGRTRDVDGRWDHAHGAGVGPGDWVLVEVEDSGRGMDETTRNRCFEPFFSTKERGHGLGLAACLGIVAAHGGAVLVESELGRGSRFSILLPACRVPERRRTMTTPARRVTRCDVLVIDDEGIVRAQLRRLLERRGYTVDEAVSGRDGLAALARKAPHVIILDMTMPDMDGAEVLRRLRAEGCRLPVIVSSGYLDPSIEQNLPADAYQAFLAKPYSIADLDAALERALGAAR